MFKRFRFYGLTEHLTDEDIIRESDGEVTFLRAQRIRRHLTACWSCRTRKQELDLGIAAFAQLYRKRFDTAIPSSERTRKLLEARFRGVPDEYCTWIQSIFSRRVMTVCTIAGLLIAGVALVSQNRPLRVSSKNIIRGTRPDLPDSSLSPGAGTAVSREFVCQMRSEEGDLINNALVHQVFLRYRINQPLPGAYEIDFVIPPALGGLATAENLWPQPYNAGNWNSHSKDALEVKLESLVCSGQLDLRRAQTVLAKDWIEAYKSYFNSEQPLLDHVAFFKDRPWPFNNR